MVGERFESPLAVAVRSWWFVRRKLFALKLKTMFSKRDPILDQRVATELAESALVEQVFARNFETLISNIRAWLPDLVLSDHGYDFDLVNDTFLWGLYAEFLEGRPPLPTEPHGRVIAHMIGYLSKFHNEPFLTARERVRKVESNFNAADPLTDEIIKIGRFAFHDSGNGHLNNCHLLAAKWKT